MNENYKFMRIIMFYFVKNRTYNKWITNDNNNKDDETITTRGKKSTIVMTSKKYIKEDQQMEDKQLESVCDIHTPKKGILPNLQKVQQATKL